MNVLDVISISVIGVFMIIGIWKGFLNLVLRFGALILSGVLAKIFGPWLGNILLPKLLKLDRLSASLLSYVNTTIATVVGTVLVFIVSLVIFKIFAGMISKAVTKETKVGVINRALGAVGGALAGIAILSLIAVVVNVGMIVIALIYPETGIFDSVENTVIFKYFLGLL